MGVWLRAKETAEQVRAEVAAEAERQRANGTIPKIAALVVGNDPASVYYAETKRKVAAKLGIEFELMMQPGDVTQEQLIRIVSEWSRDAAVHGIMLELPLPAHISTSAVAEAIDPLKDVDGVTPANRLAGMTGEPGLVPATPQSCIRLLKAYGYTLEGKNVTLVGRGQTVGLPLFHMLQREQATVTVCHSRTPDLAFHLKHADIVVAAVGKPGIITWEMIRPGTIVIDAGIHELPDGRITGDVDPHAIEVAEAMSPVPGGVGTLTTALLFENAMRAIWLQQQAGREAAR